MPNGIAPSNNVSRRTRRLRTVDIENLAQKVVHEPLPPQVQKAVDRLVALFTPDHPVWEQSELKQALGVKTHTSVRKYAYIAVKQGRLKVAENSTPRHPRFTTAQPLPPTPTPPPTAEQSEAPPADPAARGVTLLVSAVLERIHNKERLTESERQLVEQALYAFLK